MMSGAEGTKCGRRPAGERRFVSPAIEEVITETKDKLKDKQLAALFENCFPNTLDSTVTTSIINDKPDTFIVTGDIDAMWLRDSSAQVWPYLPYAKKDEKLPTLFHGLIGRQARCILLDPYANAYMRDPTALTNLPYTRQDDPDIQIRGVAERKWEIDSLCYPIRLAHGYWKATGDNTPFDDEWRNAMRTVVTTFKVQQRKTGDGPYHYPWSKQNGIGAPTKKVGLIHSGFRPSDDPCKYPFLIPSNLFAVTSLGQLAEMGSSVGFDAAFCTECSDLAIEIDTAAKQYGKHQLRDGRGILPNGAWVWAYEVDGLGKQLFMDDANTPGLLGLPYLGYCKTDDPLYQATRTAVWSSDFNEWFFKGTAAEGIGSPHTPSYAVSPPCDGGMIWPMSLIMRALNSDNDGEITQSLTALRDTTGGTGFMDESFCMNNASKFTRPWFAWANTLFGELVLDILQRKPNLLV